MTSQEMIQYLADSYQEGIIVACAIICLGYLIFSIRLLFSSRDANMHVYALAFIPVVNLFVWVVKCFKVMKIRKNSLKDTDEVDL